MGAGRPKEYSEEIITKTREYINSCVDEEYTRIKTDGATSTSYDNLVKVKLPSIEGLAVYLKISRDTIYDWQKKYPEFSDIVKELLALQAERLVNNGLNGTYNASIAKLILSKHGYVEKQETDVTSGGEALQPILVKFLDGK